MLRFLQRCLSVGGDRVDAPRVVVVCPHGCQIVTVGERYEDATLAGGAACLHHVVGAEHIVVHVQFGEPPDNLTRVIQVLVVLIVREDTHDVCCHFP